MYATATFTYVREGFPTTHEPPLCNPSNYGGLHRGGNALRQERCPRGSPLPSHADNTTFDISFTRQFYPEVPDCTPPFLPSDAAEEQRVWLSSSLLYGLTTQQARSRLTSMPSEIRRQEPAPLADPRPALYVTTRGQPTNKIPPLHSQDPS
jgi:hypothetical protein